MLKAHTDFLGYATSLTLVWYFLFFFLNRRKDILDLNRIYSLVSNTPSSTTGHEDRTLTITAFVYETQDYDNDSLFNIYLFDMWCVCVCDQNGKLASAPH